MVVESATKYWLLAITVIISAHSCNSFAVNGGHTLVLGASLTRYQTLVSKNETFALGFFCPRGTNNSYVGIWYASLSQKTIVWVANRDNPVTKMPGVLEYSSDGNLRLFDGDGLLVWSTEVGQRGSRAVITDSGNFIVLGDAQNKSAIVWESFAHPTDTYLPGMKLWKGMALNSWMSSSDPATGLFSCRMDTAPGESELLLLFNNTVPYESSGEYVRHTEVNVVNLKSVGRTDFAILTMCAVVSRASSPRTALNWVGGQTVVLGEHRCIALSQTARLTVSLKRRTNTCPKKKPSYTRPGGHNKAAGLLVSAIAPPQPTLLLLLIYLSVDCGLLI